MSQQSDSFDAAIEFARDLIRIPSPPGGEGDVAARVLAEMERLGFDDAWTDAGARPLPWADRGALVAGGGWPGAGVRQ